MKLHNETNTPKLQTATALWQLHAKTLRAGASVVSEDEFSLSHSKAAGGSVSCWAFGSHTVLQIHCWICHAGVFGHTYSSVCVFVQELGHLCAHCDIYSVCGYN